MGFVIYQNGFCNIPGWVLGFGGVCTMGFVATIPIYRHCHFA